MSLQVDLFSYVTATFVVESMAAANAWSLGKESSTKKIKAVQQNPFNVSHCLFIMHLSKFFPRRLALILVGVKLSSFLCLSILILCYKHSPHLGHKFYLLPLFSPSCLHG